MNGRRARLEEARRILKQGMSSLEPTHPFGTLTKAQRAEVAQNFKLWSESWILPALDEAIESMKPKVPK